MSTHFEIDHAMNRTPVAYDVMQLRLERRCMTTIKMLAATGRRTVSEQVRMVIEEGLKAMKVSLPERPRGPGRRE